LSLVRPSSPLPVAVDVEVGEADLIADQSGGMGGMMQDLAFAIPGVDEAMGFAEIMKYIPHLTLQWS
jgi:anion-transporting  ArsA/GET3 family ATPase